VVSVLLVTTSWSSASADAHTGLRSNVDWATYGVAISSSELHNERVLLAHLSFDPHIRDTARDDTQATFLHERTEANVSTRPRPRARLRLWPWLEAAVAAAAAVSGSALALDAQRSRELSALERTTPGRSLAPTNVRAPRLAITTLALGMFGMAGLVTAAVKRLTLRTGDTDNAWALRIGCTQLTLTTHF